MAFVLTLAYIVLTIVSPNQFGQQFADFRPIVCLAIVITLLSLPNLLDNILLRSSIQTRLLFAFIVAIGLSQLANGRFRDAVESSREILPSVAVFFFVCANANTMRRLKIVTWVTIGTCLGLSVEALCGYYGGFLGDRFILLQYGIPRVRAAGFLSDPNDLAQMLLIALSLIFVSWNRRRIVSSSFIVFVPLSLLLWAIYLTHSRGALIALGVLVLAAFHKKLGTIPSGILAGCLVFGMMAIDFTGGRGISASDGTDRLELWSQGLELFKSAPLFGTGFGTFADLSGLTAHNSFVLCLAELGLVGSTVFVALLVTTMFGLNGIINSYEMADSVPDSRAVPEGEDLPVMSERESEFYEERSSTAAIEAEADSDTRPAANLRELGIESFAVAMRLALISFIVTSFFLSRSYTATTYLVLGLAGATMALGPEASQSDHRRWGLVSLAVGLSSIVFIYSVVRFRH